MPKLKNQTSKSTKKNLRQARIPRISTRGFYDLNSGKSLKKRMYDLYPTKFFESLGEFPEFTIMIHGLRNNKGGALAKVVIAQKRLKQLGYKYPVVGFSYDSNTRGVQYKSQELKATKIGKTIAKKNGKNLAQFILNFKRKNPTTKIRLIGHSLGTEVIVYALANLKNNNGIVEAVYFFGGSIPANSIHPKRFGKDLQNTVNKKIINYYSPHDGVLKYEYEAQLLEKPIGYMGKEGKSVSKYTQKKVRPKNHRFVSYASVLRTFP